MFSITAGCCPLCLLSQNVLDAFRAEDEIASQPESGDAATARGAAEAQAGVGAGGEAVFMRQRRRKPPRCSNSFLLRTTESNGLGFSGLSNIGGISSLLGFKVRLRTMGAT